MLVLATQKSCVEVYPNAKPQHEWFRVAVEYRLYFVIEIDGLCNIKTDSFI